jgi:hypothetical protein
LGLAQCYSNRRSNRRRAFGQRPGRDRCQLPPDFHVPRMQRPLVCNVSSRCLDAGPACTTAARPPTTSRPTLPTSCHFRSTHRACSQRPCTLPPRPRSGREVDHYFPHSYRRAPATPLEPAIATVPRPPSTAASGAPPAPSTPPLASLELEVALHPHQSRQPTPADHLTGVPLRPTAHRRRATATVSLPSPFAPNRSRHHPGPLPGHFPADQRRPAGRISPVSRRRRGGISLPYFLGWAEMPSRLGRNAK